MSGKTAYLSSQIKKLIPVIKHKSVYLKYWISSDSG